MYISDKHIKTFYNKKLFIEFTYMYIYKNMILLHNFHEIKIITRRHSGDLKSFAILSKSIMKKTITICEVIKNFSTGCERFVWLLLRDAVLF